VHAAQQTETIAEALKELTEVLLYLAGYVGVPLIREALLTASAVSIFD
jgi:hypothetical protein